MDKIEEGTLSLPIRSMIVTCGPAGSGKSTVVSSILQHNRLANTTAVASDTCRFMICDEIESVKPEQWRILQPNTFKLLLTIVGMRMELDRPVMVDGVNLFVEQRSSMLELARKHKYRTVLLVLDLPLHTCLLQNAQRHESRRLPEGQIRAQREALDKSLPGLAEEGWDDIIVLNDQRRTIQVDVL